jgi:hypothetical protein
MVLPAMFRRVTPEVAGSSSVILVSDPEIPILL